MKKKQWFCIAAIILCAAVFLGYRVLDGIRTDDRAPEITVDGTLTLSVLEPREALLQGVSAKDDRDGNVTASLVVESISLPDPEQPATVVYAAFDSAGNVTKKERKVVFSDYRSPRFSLNGPMIYMTNTSFDVLDRIEAEDVLDGEIGSRVRATSLSEESIGTLGVHDVEFRVTNSLGDTAKIVLPVEVVPMDTYRAQLTLTDYLVYIPVGTNFNARDYLYDFTLLEETTYLRGTFPEELELKISGQVDTSVPGVYAVSYTVTGLLREEPYAGYSKLIVIVEG